MLLSYSLICLQPMSLTLDDTCKSNTHTHLMPELPVRASRSDPAKSTKCSRAVLHKSSLFLPCGCALAHPSS